MRLVIAFRLARYYLHSGLTFKNAVRNAWRNTQ